MINYCEADLCLCFRIGKNPCFCIICDNEIDFLVIKIISGRSVVKISQPESK